MQDDAIVTNERCAEYTASDQQVFSASSKATASITPESRLSIGDKRVRIPLWLKIGLYLHWHPEGSRACVSLFKLGLLEHSFN